MNNTLRKTGLGLLMGAAIVASPGAFAQDDSQMELIESIKQQFADIPGVIGGFQDGVVTLGGQMENRTAFEKLKQDLMDLDGVDDVRSSVTFR